MSDGDKDAEAARKHSWGTTGVTLVGGAILGIVGTIIAATVSNKYQLDQFWREQRLAAYTNYLDTLQKLEASESSANSRLARFGVREFNGVKLSCITPTAIDYTVIAADDATVQNLVGELKAKKSKVDAFSAGSAQEVTKQIESEHGRAILLRSIVKFEIRNACEQGKGNWKLDGPLIGTSEFIQSMREELDIPNR